VRFLLGLAAEDRPNSQHDCANEPDDQPHRIIVDDDASDVPSGVTSTLEALTEATNTYDTEALGALLTEDSTWQSTSPRAATT
jgi:hypothetical protein